MHTTQFKSAVIFDRFLFYRNKYHFYTNIALETTTEVSNEVILLFVKTIRNILGIIGLSRLCRIYI